MKRGDIYYADLRPVVGSEQGGVRPVLIVQNDTGNRHLCGDHIKTKQSKAPDSYRASRRTVPDGKKFGDIAGTAQNNR